MDPKILNTITSQVYRQFPELKGVRPKVHPQTGPLAKSALADPTYLLTFEGSATTADGRTILRLVRVTATALGKILKISTSR